MSDLQPATQEQRPTIGRGSAPWVRHACVGILVAGWAIVLALILRHRVFVSHDTVSNYAHVWYISDRLSHVHALPFRMPVIGHGEAYAFPYAFVPWLSAAILHPLLGDWVVTLWLVVGTVGLIGATFWAFPELLEGWGPAAVLVNPALVAAAIIGQLPFVWAAAFLLGAVGCWRRQRRWEAAVLAGLGQATHPAVVLPIGLALVAGWLWWEADRRALVRWYAVALLVTLPAALLVYASPVFQDSSRSTIAMAFAETLGVRMLVVVIPLLLCLFRALRWHWVAPAAMLAMVVANVALLQQRDIESAWKALRRHPSPTMLTFIRSDAFVRGATYRVLRAGDSKIGMYQLLQHGARLDSEFFPESVDIRSWRRREDYTRFLRSRNVDFVIVFPSFDRAYRTNEHKLLDDLVTLSSTSCAGSEIAGPASVVRRPRYDIYRIERGCARPTAMASDPPG
jgi:hypothetical protein